MTKTRFELLRLIRLAEEAECFILMAALAEACRRHVAGKPIASLLRGALALNA